MRPRVITTGDLSPEFNITDNKLFIKDSVYVTVAKLNNNDVNFNAAFPRSNWTKPENFKENGLCIVIFLDGVAYFEYKENNYFLLKFYNLHLVMFL